MLRKYIRNLPTSVQWIILIAFSVILPFLPISEFMAGFMAGMFIMIFAHIDHIHPKEKEEDERVEQDKT